MVIYLFSKISLVDSDRLWFKAKIGLSVNQVARDVSFCSYAVNQPGDVLIIEDAWQDYRCLAA